MLRQWKETYPKFNQIYVDENKNTFACKNCDQYNSKEVYFANVQKHIKRCGTFEWKKFNLGRWQKSDPAFNNFVVDEQTNEFVCDACKEYRQKEGYEQRLKNHLNNCENVSWRSKMLRHWKETYPEFNQIYVDENKNTFACKNCDQYNSKQTKLFNIQRHIKRCQNSETINETIANDDNSNNPIFVELFGYSPEPPNPNECYHSIEDYYRHTTYDNGANEDQVLQPGIEQSGQRRSNTLTIQEGRQRRSRPRVIKGKGKQKVVISSDDNSSKSN
ncbi:hypothetical protein Mgra_00007551 [Meloidogyne graminicola]|uniref:Uncharacterized protein n=1 Tax=Meloidogyne graminicola TaxID=189291 RepID=A0A8S9ZIC1_9BILA|nr:hypothetical protein Mgra_00007551 [Meloidogyne graminicola]